MAKWADEIKTAVDPVVNNVSAVEARLVLQVGLILIVYIADYGLPTERENQNIRTDSCNKSSFECSGPCTCRLSPLITCSSSATPSLVLFAHLLTAVRS